MANTRVKTKFLSGDEAQQYFAGLSKVNLEEFPVITKLKVWPGINLGAYKYVEGLVNPELVDRFKVTNIGVERHGPTATIASLITGNCYEITCNPTLLLGGGVAANFPQRPYFERTIQLVEGSTQYNVSICTCLQIYHKTRPDWRSDGVEFIDIWSNIIHRFTDYGTYHSGVKRLYESAYTYCR